MEDEELDYSKSVVETDDKKENGEKDYARLIAAQNESARRIKILGIERDIKDADKKRKGFSIAAGICFMGALVATHFSGVDPNDAIKTEMEALSSFDAVKEYLGYFTPAMWTTIIGTAVSFSRSIKAKKKYNKARQDLVDMIDNPPELYQYEVERQARNK